MTLPVHRSKEEIDPDDAEFERFCEDFPITACVLHIVFASIALVTIATMAFVTFDILTHF